MARGRLFWFGESAIEGNGVQVTDQGLHGYGSLAGFRLPPAALTLPGRHNAANVAAAAAAALALEVPVDSVATAVRRFRGLKHRLQLVWRSPQGVAFYDDLNSTTPTATIAALRTLGPGVVWIFGGDDKGLASDELAEVAEGTVRVGLALPGQGTRRILRDLAAAGVATEEEPDLKQAVARAVALAGASDSVLLSPACPGFFTRFYGGGGEDSGFRRLVKEATTPA